MKKPLLSSSSLLVSGLAVLFSAGTAFAQPVTEPPPASAPPPVVTNSPSPAAVAASGEGAGIGGVLEPLTARPARRPRPDHAVATALGRLPSRQSRRLSDNGPEATRIRANHHRCTHAVKPCQKAKWHRYSQLMKNRLCVNGVHCACSGVTLLIYRGGNGYFTWYDDDR